MTKPFFLFISFFILLCSLNAADAPSRAATLFKQCSGCHGADGQNKAFGKSGIIAGQSAEDIIESLNFFKESDFKTHSSTTVMAKQVKNLSNQDIIDLANFISKLKKQ